MNIADIEAQSHWLRERPEADTTNFDPYDVIIDGYRELPCSKCDGSDTACSECYPPF